MFISCNVLIWPQFYTKIDLKTSLFAGALGPVSYIWRAPVITLVWRSDGSKWMDGMSNGWIKFIEPEPLT